MWGYVWFAFGSSRSADITFIRSQDLPNFYRIKQQVDQYNVLLALAIIQSMRSEKLDRYI